MKVKVYAKINLTLNVLGKTRGYHKIDSVVTSVDIFDVVDVVARTDRRVNVTGLPQVATERNTAYKAACAFVKQFGVCGADIVIDKRIPFGAGLGGSSADAAAAVYCMCSLYGVNVNSDEVRCLCASIGSDINFMLHGGLGLLRGKGDDVQFYVSGSPVYFALTTFDTAVSSAQAYAQFDKLGADVEFTVNSELIKVLEHGKAESASQCFGNHLQPAVSSLSDYAADYLCFCNSHSLACNMTGSGSAYYVAYDSEQSAQRTAKLLCDNGFDTTVCKSVSKGIVILQC